MTPDEVVKVLEEYFDEANVGGQPNKYLIRKQQALSSAISLIQDYQKLRKRVSVEKIEKIYYNNQGNYALTQHQKLICQAIITYLGGG